MGTNNKLKPYEKCPKCGSEELEPNCKQRDDHSMTELVICNDCGHSWREVYSLELIAITDEHDPGEED